MQAARRIEPKFVERVWGAPSLAPWFPSINGAPRIGEVWFEAGGLLVKFLYTTEPLSVQVHPDDDCARARGLRTGKTEMWHVLRAEPGARIALGFREPFSRERIREAALDGSIEHLLDWHVAAPGDTFFTPAGTVHALGGGLVVLEIQQICDTTYRLYDYNRGRELHLDDAIAVLDPCARPGKSETQLLGGGGVALARCQYFAAESWTLASSRLFPGGAALVVLDGSGLVDGQPAASGQVWHLDAASEFAPNGEAKVVCAYVPAA
jgi:mannose-6-phosphate isomerase